MEPASDASSGIFRSWRTFSSSWSAEEAGRDGVKPKDVSEHMGAVLDGNGENIQRLPAKARDARTLRRVRLTVRPMR